MSSEEQQSTQPCECLQCITCNAPPTDEMIRKRKREEDESALDTRGKRDRSEAVKETHTRIVSITGPTDLTNFVIHCNDGLDVHVCFEFLQAYCKYFNLTLKQITPQEVSLPYNQKVVTDVVSVIVSGHKYPTSTKTISNKHARERFELMDYLDCDFGAKILLKSVFTIEDRNKSWAYLEVPQYRDELRGYLRDNIVLLRNSSKAWPLLKEHIDHILQD